MLACLKVQRRSAVKFLSIILRPKLNESLASDRTKPNPRVRGLAKPNPAHVRDPTATLFTCQWPANSNLVHVITSISRDSGWPMKSDVTWGHLYHVAMAGQLKPWSREDIYIMWQWLANSNPGHVSTSISCGSGWPITTLVTWGHLYHVAVAGQF